MAVLRKKSTTDKITDAAKTVVTKPVVIGGGLALAGAAAVVKRVRGGSPAGDYVAPPGQFPVEIDDNTLAHKVETEIFRPANAPKGQVSVNAEHGVIFLRGSLDDAAQAEELATLAAAVDGVKGVENLLNTP